MKLLEIFQQLKTEGALKHDLFRKVKNIVVPDSGEQLVPHPIPPDQWRGLFQVWSTNPEAFFKVWSLPGTNSKGDVLQPEWERGQELPGNSAVKSGGIYSMIRLIYHSIYIHDFVLSYSLRRKSETNALPRNLRKFIKKAWGNNTLNKGLSDSLADYIKVGHICHRLGKSTSETSWFLYPSLVSKLQRPPDPSTLAEIKKRISESELDNSVAKRIRRSHLELGLSTPLPKRSRRRNGQSPSERSRPRNRELKPRSLSPPPLTTAEPSGSTWDIQSGRSNTSPYYDDRYPPTSAISVIEPQGNAWDSIPLPAPNNQLLLGVGYLPLEVWDDAFEGEPEEPSANPLWDDVFLVEPGNVWETPANPVYHGLP